MSTWFQTETNCRVFYRSGTVSSPVYQSDLCDDQNLDKSDWMTQARKYTKEESAQHDNPLLNYLYDSSVDRNLCVFNRSGTSGGKSLSDNRQLHGKDNRFAGYVCRIEQQLQHARDNVLQGDRLRIRRIIRR